MGRNQRSEVAGLCEVQALRAGRPGVTAIDIGPQHPYEADMYSPSRRHIG